MHRLCYSVGTGNETRGYYPSSKLVTCNKLAGRLLNPCSSAVVIARWVRVRYTKLERRNPWPHVANRHVSVSQLLSSWCYLFTVSNSGLLFYTKRVSTTPTRPASHAHFRHGHISVTDTFLDSSVKLIVV